MVKVKFFTKERIAFNAFSIIGIIKLHDGKFLLGSFGSISIYSMQDKKIEMTIDFSNKRCYEKINVFTQLSNELIVIAVPESEIKDNIQIFWFGKDKYKKMKTISNAHSNRFNDIIELSDERFATCGNEPYIIIYNGIPPYNKITSIDTHSTSVQSMLEVEEKKYLIVSTKEKQIQIWNMRNYSCETIIGDICSSSNRTMRRIANNKIIVGGEKCISTIDLNSFKVMYDPIEGTVISIIELRDTEIAFVVLTNEDDSLVSLKKYNYNHHIFDTLMKYITNDFNYYSLVEIDKKSFILSSNALYLWKY